MKQTLFVSLIFVVVCTALPGGEHDPITAGVHIDARAAKALWSEDPTLSAAVIMQLNDQFSLSIPVAYYADQSGISLVDTALILRCRPSSLGAWIGVSLMQGISMHGTDRPSNWYHHMCELQMGYTLKLTNWMYLEPFVALRDPGNMFAESLEVINTYVEGYSRMYVSLRLGVIGLPLTIR
ncbi:MAG: hypothetical protein ACQEQU_08210 [Spirochaetota bacterium]